MTERDKERVPGYDDRDARDFAEEEAEEKEAAEESFGMIQALADITRRFTP